MPMTVACTNFGGPLIHENRGGTESFYTTAPPGSGCGRETMGWKRKTMLTKLLSIGITVLSANHGGIILSEKVQPAGVFVSLTPAKSGFLVTIRNKSLKPIVFCPKVPWIVIYHRSSSGIETAVSYDASNAEVAHLNAFETVSLMPGAVYEMLLPVWHDKYNDRRPLLRKGGRVYARLKKLSSYAFKPNLQQQARKAPLLSLDIRSNELVAPIAFD